MASKQPSNGTKGPEKKQPENPQALRKRNIWVERLLIGMMLLQAGRSTASSIQGEKKTEDGQEEENKPEEAKPIGRRIDARSPEEAAADWLNYRLRMGGKDADPASETLVSGLAKRAKTMMEKVAADSSMVEKDFDLVPYDESMQKQGRVISQLLGGKWFKDSNDLFRAIKDKSLVYVPQIDSYITFSRLYATQSVLDQYVQQKIISQEMADSILLEEMEPVRDKEGEVVLDSMGQPALMRKSLADLYNGLIAKGETVKINVCWRSNLMQAIALADIKGTDDPNDYESGRVLGPTAGHHILGMACDVGGISKGMKKGLEEKGIKALTEGGIEAGHLSMAESDIDMEDKLIRKLKELGPRALKETGAKIRQLRRYLGW